MDNDLQNRIKDLRELYLKNLKDKLRPSDYAQGYEDGLRFCIEALETVFPEINRYAKR